MRHTPAAETIALHSASLFLNPLVWSALPSRWQILVSRNTCGAARLATRFISRQVKDLLQSATFNNRDASSASFAQEMCSYLSGNMLLHMNYKPLSGLSQVLFKFLFTKHVTFIRRRHISSSSNSSPFLSQCLKGNGFTGPVLDAICHRSAVPLL